MAPGSGPRVTLSGDGDAQAGHVTLRWTLERAAGAGTEAAADQTPVFQLEESSSGDFAAGSLRYEGAHQSSVVSGLPNGARHFRVRAQTPKSDVWGPWSAPFVFETRHHSLALAGSLFGVGALAFALTAGFVIVASRRAEGIGEEPGGDHG